MSATAQKLVIMRAAELAKSGKAYIPRLDETAAACDRQVEHGMMTRALTDLNGREVYAYSLTPLGVDLAKRYGVKS